MSFLPPTPTPTVTDADTTPTPAVTDADTTPITGAATDTAVDERRAKRLSGVGLALIVVAAAFVATRLHRTGHTTGDDFALYLRQARSLFEGNVAQVISDNRLLWENSSLVTPPIYPWGWPLLLSPFVRVWGLDYERLKLLEVACLCVWLVLFHGIVRRRAGRIVAFALTAVFATSTAYLSHTDQLLTELPHLTAVALVIWWLDRTASAGSLLTASTTRLVVLGLLGVLVFNIRREGIVIIPMIAVAQLVDLGPAWSRVRASSAGLRQAVADLPWKALMLPHFAFVVGVVVFQLMLPSTLLPDNGNDRKWIFTRLWGGGKNDPEFTKSYPLELVKQLGFSDPSWRWGRALLVIAVAGMILSCVWKPRRNLPLTTVTVITMLIIGTHPRWVNRYYLQVTPLIVYFVAIAPIAAWHLLAEGSWLRRRLGARRLRVATLALAVAVAAPALWVTKFHVTGWPKQIDRVATYNDNGPQRGPTHADYLPVYDAVLEHTEPDDIIVYYRARTMTLYTDRRAVQTQSVANAERLGDFFMLNKQSAYSQPKAEDTTPDKLSARGWTIVWENKLWTLWKLPESDGIAPVRTNTVFEPTDTTP